MIVRILAATAGLTLVAAGCGDDDGEEVRDSESASASEASGSASGPPECRPFGDSSTADSTVDVTLGEFFYEIDADEIPAGSVTFVGDNVGALPHEYVIAEGTDVPLDDEGVPDEEALGDRVLGEVPAYPGQSVCEGTFDLESGQEYVMFCALVEEDGTNHYTEGMVTTFTVS